VPSRVLRRHARKWLSRDRKPTGERTTDYTRRGPGKTVEIGV
jgi:hypothetical protein